MPICALKTPRFPPDGQRIAFVHNEDGTNNLGLIDRDGTDLVYLTNNNDATQYMPRASRPTASGCSLACFAAKTAILR